MDKEVVIVTGSCGRIGSSLVKRLGEEYRVVGFELLKALYASANEELVPVDISSDESVAQAFMHIRNFYGNRIASVIHLAAYYSFSDLQPDKYDAITVQGTKRLLKELQKFEVGQFIFSSTMLVHAPCKPGEKIKEDWPVQPKWAYPQSKVRTEKIIREERGKIPALIMRIAGVYDDHCHSIPISNQIQRIYENQLESHFFSGDTSHGSSFMHMDDLVDALCLAVEKRSTLPPEAIVLLGEPSVLSYQRLQDQIGQLLQNKKWKTIRIPKSVAMVGSWLQNHLPLVPKSFIKPWMIPLADDHYDLDISLAEKLLAWKPKRSLEKTLPLMIDFLKKDPAKWYKENGLKYSKK
jgi:nucleoside-diphosphate-sugar epimerase